MTQTQPHKSKPEITTEVPHLKKTYTEQEHKTVQRKLKASAPDDHEMLYDMIMGPGWNHSYELPG